MTARSYRAWFWTLALVGLTLDQATKYGVFSWLEPGERREYVPRVFSIVHQPELNRGALFGIGNDAERPANPVFAVVSAVAILVILIWACRRGTATDKVLNIALGLILGGAIGNLYDRLVYGGVRDFLWVYYQSAEDGRLLFNWPVFNVADSCLVCGACWLLLQAFFTPTAKAPAAGAVPSAAEGESASPALPGSP
jgi:lipoprotein signal peptidase